MLGHPSGRSRPFARAGRLSVLALLAASGLLVTACADFEDEAAPQAWQTQPELTPEAGPQPELPESGGEGSTPAVPPSTEQSIPPPQGCKDFDPTVLATCLDTVSAVAALPGGGANPSAVAVERKSGRVLQVQKGTEPTELAKLNVDASGDGGLTGVALSPSYLEDQLIYAYITTRSDNRVVRIAPDQPPKPVLTGIPRGGSGNRGVLGTDNNGALLVATGDAGDAAAAKDPNSLAGKVLRINNSGEPAPGNPRPGSRVIARGLHAPGGVCTTRDGGQTWVTDQAPDKDSLYRIVHDGKRKPGDDLVSPAWTWPDRPGVAGCAASQEAVSVATSGAGNVQSLSLHKDGTFQGKPQVLADGKDGYGKLSGMDLLGEQTAVVGTVNKDGGQPVSSDDRVVVIVRQGGGGSAD